MSFSTAGQGHEAAYSWEEVEACSGCSQSNFIWGSVSVGCGALQSPASPKLVIYMAQYSPPRIKEQQERKGGNAATKENSWRALARSGVATVFRLKLWTTRQTKLCDYQESRGQCWFGSMWMHFANQQIMSVIELHRRISELKKKKCTNGSLTAIYAVRQLSTRSYYSLMTIATNTFISSRIVKRCCQGLIKVKGDPIFVRAIQQTDIRLFLIVVKTLSNDISHSTFFWKKHCKTMYLPVRAGRPLMHIYFPSQWLFGKKNHSDCLLNSLTSQTKNYQKIRLNEILELEIQHQDNFP